jgi:hypothetical protein
VVAATPHSENWSRMSTEPTADGLQSFCILSCGGNHEHSGTCEPGTRG